uniref:Uncharacterized protein n=1 Tax=Coccolithus braarudii TaxID=221442 RepID=A0A7S0Q7M5_9EUKA
MGSLRAFRAKFTVPTVLVVTHITTVPVTKSTITNQSTAVQQDCTLLSCWDLPELLWRLGRLPMGGEENVAHKLCRRPRRRSLLTRMVSDCVQRDPAQGIDGLHLHIDGAQLD